MPSNCVVNISINSHRKIFLSPLIRLACHCCEWYWHRSPRLLGVLSARWMFIPKRDVYISPSKAQETLKKRVQKHGNKENIGRRLWNTAFWTWHSHYWHDLTVVVKAGTGPVNSCGWVDRVMVQRLLPLLANYWRLMDSGAGLVIVFSHVLIDQESVYNFKPNVNCIALVKLIGTQIKTKPPKFNMGEGFIRRMEEGMAASSKRKIREVVD